MDESKNMALSMVEWKILVKDLDQFAPAEDLIERIIKNSNRTVLYYLLAKCYDIYLEYGYQREEANSLYVTLLQIYNKEDKMSWSFEKTIFRAVLTVFREDEEKNNEKV